MPLSSTPFPEIDESTLQRLIDNGVPEGLNIDYKRDPIGSSDSEKREFLKDVSSFANAAGGYLIIGMDESEGVPTNLVGLPSINQDTEIQRLENILRDNVEPRLVGMMMRAVPISKKGPAIIMRVPRSWNPPHRVNFKGWNKFFTRNSNGSHELSVEELRSSFTLAASVLESVNEFRIERLAKITADDGPVQIEHNGCLVMHVVPLAAVGAPAFVDFEIVAQNPEYFRAISSVGISQRINFDGMLVPFAQQESGRFFSYLQLFRNGCIETACGNIHMDHTERRGFSRVIPWSDIDAYLFEVLPGYIKGLGLLGIGPPYAVMVSFLDMRGSVILTDGIRNEPVPLNRDDLLVRPILLDVTELTGEWHHLMRPALDAFWNAYGYMKARNFNEDGKWTKKN